MNKVLENSEEFLIAINKLNRDIDALIDRHKALIGQIDQSPNLEDEQKQELVGQLVPWCL